MRLIGHLESESGARTFGDYLFVQGIENQIELHKDEGWAVWINDEDKIQRAASLLKTFLQDPADPKYQAEGKNAARLRAEQQKEVADYTKKIRTRRQLVGPTGPYGFGPLTLVLIIFSAGAFIVSKFGNDFETVRSLFITEHLLANYRDFTSMLPEVRHGQLWRLVTPIFLHFNWPHIIFNMLCLRDLGSMIEGRQSSVQLAILVLVFGICSNVGQFYVSGPVFGGMSGVIYGLLGYVWIRGKFDPASGLFLHPSTVAMMLIWFVLCYTPLLGHIANTAHAVGLVMGVAWGYLSSLPHR
jgi:GlpG protein